MWMVRAGRGGDNIEDFIKHGLVALGDSRLGKLDPSSKKEDLLKLFAAKYPEEKEGSRAVWASQFVRLIREIKIDDEVVTFDRDHRLYFIGMVTGEYAWEPSLISDKPHLRRVLWKYQVPRDLLRADTRNALGCRFKINGKTTETPVVRGAFAFALKDMNQHVLLVVHGGSKHFARLHRNGGVAVNDDVHQAAEGFDAERQGGDVEQ